MLDLRAGTEEPSDILSPKLIKSAFINQKINGSVCQWITAHEYITKVSLQD